jgi:hypothetical protein
MPTGASASRIVPLAAARRRPAKEARVVYELARLRVAGMREPPPRFAHLVRSHD